MKSHLSLALAGFIARITNLVVGRQLLLVLLGYGAMATGQPVSAADCVPPPSGLVNWWRAEQDAADALGRNSGQALNGVRYTNGLVGAAFYFDGVDDRVIVSNSAALNFGPGADFSIEAWIKPEVATTDFGVQSIVDKRYTPNSFAAVGWEFGLIDGKLACQLADAPLTPGDFSTFVSAGPDLRDGTYHHVALVLQRGSATGGKLLVDGQVVLTFDPTVQPGDLGSTEPLRIGAHADAALNSHFTGAMDEVSIYNRALSVGEIVTLYTAGSAGKCAPPSPSQNLLNIDFGYGNSSSKVGFAAIGRTVADYWNFYSRDDGSGGYRTFGAVNNLKFANGAISSAGLTVANAPGAWGNGSSDAMYQKSVYPFDGGNITVSVTNLPVGQYDFYLYNQQGNYQVTVGGTDYGIKTTSDPANTSPPVWQEGKQYAVFRNVQVANVGQAATITVRPVGGGLALISGMQIATVSTTSPPSCVSAPSGLESWWRAESDALDRADGNNGTLQNGATFAAGKVGQAFSFDGVDDFVSVADAPNLRFGPTSPMTVDMWVFRTSSNPGQHMIGKRTSCTGSSTEGTFQLFLDMNTGAGLGFGGPGGACACSGQDLPLNSWTHLAGTFDGTTLRLFINGQLAGTTPGSLGPANTAPLKIGDSGSCGAFYGQAFGGLIDEVSFYNRALSTNEIQAIYTADSAGKCVVSNPLPVAPIIVSQPTNVTVNVGSNVTLRVTATGGAPLSYQWRFNGTNLVGKTSSVLSLTSVQFSNAGPYSVVISNAGGSITSSNAVLTVNPLPDCAPPPAGLVSWWRAEKTANDDWDSNNGTTPRGPLTTSGKVGSAFAFDGPIGSIQVNDSPSLRVTNALTLEAWVNPSSVSGTTPRTILSKFDYPLAQPVGTQSAYLLGTTNNGRLFFAVSATGSARTNTTLVTTQALPINQWTFVVATYDGAALRLYLNGTLAAQTNYSGGIFPGTANLGIGAIPYDTFSQFLWPLSGLLDEVSLYNRALTDGEILAIFNADLVGKCLVAPSIVTQPQAQAIPLGEDVKFTVSVLGNRPLKYQWRFNGAVIAGATNSALVLEKVKTNQAGFYHVAVTNAVGFAISERAQLSLLPAPTCTDSPAGLISWWPADGLLADAMGSNNSTSFSPTLYVTGKVDRAFSFNGISSRIQVNSSGSLNFGSNADFSIETWIKVLALSSNILPISGRNSTNTPIIEKRSVSGSTGIGYSLSLNQGRLAFWLGTSPVGSNNGSVFISSGPDLRDSMFHHVAVSLERNSTNGGKLYVDGQVVLTFDPTARRGDLSNTSSFLIGAPTSLGTGLFFSGLIDEPALYNRALTASEILAIRQAGAAGKCKVKPAILVQPVSQRVTIGSNVTFNVTAAGTPLLRYQWLRSGQSLGNPATNSSYTFKVLSTSGGNYSVRVTNIFGTVTSSNVALSINHPPSAYVSGQPFFLPEDTTLVFGTGFGSGAISAGSDSDNDPLTFIIVTPPTNGTLTLTASNMIYRPTPNFNGPDSFSYKLNDGLADSNVETVRLTFWPVNDPPVALSQLLTTAEDTAIPITLGAFDVDGDALTYSVTPPAHGTLSGGVPNLTYTPAANYSGSDLFTFTVMDPSNAVSQLAAVSITVRPVNDAPVARIEVAPLDELPGVTNLVSIAPVCCEATLRLDASGSTDVENDALTYIWLEGTNVLSTEVIVTNRFQPGMHEFTLLVSDGTDVTSASITVEIITPAEAVDFLKALVEEGIAERRDRAPLVNWLREAGKAFERCHVEPGVKFLERFKQRVQDRIAPTDAELAAALMETATAIIEAAPDCDPCHRLERHHHQRGKDKERDGREERDENGKSDRDDRDHESKSERDDQTDRPEARSVGPEVRAGRSFPKSR